MKKLAILLAALFCLCVFAATAEQAGNWQATTDATVTDEARAALEKALEEFDGSSVEPVALLGTQVVAGTNFAILCRVTPVVPDPVPSYAVAYVYAALDGSCELLEFDDIDLYLDDWDEDEDWEDDWDIEDDEDWDEYDD